METPAAPIPILTPAQQLAQVEAEEAALKAQIAAAPPVAVEFTTLV